MIPLVIAILLLIGGILVSRKFIQVREWLIWSCIMADIYMRDGIEATKPTILKLVGKIRFPFMVRLIPMKEWEKLIERIDVDIKEMKNSVCLYKVLIYGVNFYYKDYLILMNLLDDMGKEIKA